MHVANFFDQPFSTQRPFPPANKNHQTCQNKSCPTSTKSFRTEQCENFNSVPFRSNFYDWEEFDVKGLIKTNIFSPCKLYCKARKFDFFYALADKAIDGTPCAMKVNGTRAELETSSPSTPSSSSRNKRSLTSLLSSSTDSQPETGICVDGTCQKLACDNNINSPATLDNCGVCNGQNNTCTNIEQEIFIKTFPNLNQSGIILGEIPKNSKKINFKINFLDQAFFNVKIRSKENYEDFVEPNFGSDNIFILGPAVSALEIVVTFSSLLGISLSQIFGKKLGRVSFIGEVGAEYVEYEDDTPSEEIRYQRGNVCSTTWAGFLVTLSYRTKMAH